MRDVVIIGGGLTGLSAAYELEQHNIDYTLIEVKRELGGGIRSVAVDDFVMDLGTFAIADNLDTTWLDSLGLADSLFPIQDGGVAFKQGTAQLVKAIEAKLVAPRLMRMAVSSIGELDNGKCAICLENGVMLDAKNLIITVPARYAQRLFYGYINPITEKLLDYHYDSIFRVTLIYRTGDIPEKIWNPPQMDFVFLHRTEHESRVPAGYTMLQLGMRLEQHHVESVEAVIGVIRHHLKLPEPVKFIMGYWAEADPISCYDDEHSERLAEIRGKLPENIALVGSDYLLNPPAQKGVARFEERIEQGRLAAQRMIANLKGNNV